jgi:hypothetical protein
MGYVSTPTSVLSFIGKSLPPSVWSSGVLYLPKPLTDAHKDILNDNGWMQSYQPTGGKEQGGQSPKDAKDHLVNRFLNSSARMQFVCADPLDEQTAVRNMVLDQLGDGNIFLLDLAAGNGAGTLALLSFLCELRIQRSIPKLPLNVSIVGVDYSENALEFYANLLERLTPWLSSAGIYVSLATHSCDIRVSGVVSEVLESFFPVQSKTA